MSLTTEPPSGRLGARTWFRQTRAFARRYLRENSRDRIGAFWSFAFPALWYALTVHLGMVPNLGTGNRPLAKAVLGISFGVFGALTVSLVGFSGQLASDLHEKRYRKFRSLPLYPSADLAGRFVSGSILGVLSFATVLVVAAIDGATYRPASVLSLLVVPLGVVFFCLVGMVGGLLTTLAIPRPEHATTVGTGVLIVVFFGTGYNGLVTTAFQGAPWLLNVIPNSVATRLTVFHLTDLDWTLAGLAPPPAPSSFEHLLILGGYAVGFATLGVVVTNRYVYASDAGE